mmetsp:Transcript_38398/g.62549  ORF Transcript_38398/g.62549 Transcript_38398/m.62549 type:complete len:90 (-) Transcript_38398:1074-1343(-)
MGQKEKGQPTGYPEACAAFHCGASALFTANQSNKSLVQTPFLILQGLHTITVHKKSQCHKLAPFLKLCIRCLETTFFLRVHFAEVDFRR